MKLIKGTSSLKAAVTGFESARGKLLVPYVHQLGASLIEHMREHGDHTLLTRLANATPGTVKKADSKRSQFIAWCERMTWLVYNTTEKCFEKIGGTIVDLETIVATAWYVEPAKAAKASAPETIEADETSEAGEVHVATVREQIAEFVAFLRTVGADVSDYEFAIEGLSKDLAEALYINTVQATPVKFAEAA